MPLGAVPGGLLVANIRVVIGTQHLVDPKGFSARATDAGILEAHTIEMGRMELVLDVRLPRDLEEPPRLEEVAKLALEQLRERLAGICRPDAPLLALQVEAIFDERYGIV